MFLELVTIATAAAAYLLACFIVVGPLLGLLAGAVFLASSLAGGQAPPPPVPGLHRAGARDAARFIGWQRAQRRYRTHRTNRHGTPRPLADRAAAAATYALYIVTAPMALVLQALLMARPSTYYYDDGHAILAITTTRHGWHIGDHVAAPQPGHPGKRLRRTLAAALIEHADAQHVAITATATAKLAAEYQHDMPQLCRTGTDQLGRTVLRYPCPDPTHHNTH